MAFRAGQLDRKLTLQSWTETQDSTGEPIITYVDAVTVPCRALHIRGTEIYKSDRIVSKKVIRFIIRYRTDVDKKMRIKYEGEFFDIEHIGEIHRREGMELVGELIE